MNLDAVLRIAAKVTGTESVQALGRGIDNAKRSASGFTGAIRGLASSMGPLGGVLQSLAPALTGAGLAAMAHSAITTADNMNDLRQKTGVSVEVLSQFSRAAEMSGTTIEGVGGAMTKLNRGMAEAARTGKGPAVEALRTLGISATDAQGKLRTADQVMLDVAARFAKMPDGAQKAGLAIQLFGRAGADMIPMLNMGDKAIRDLSVTMTTEFAESADELNDKLAQLQADFSRIGIEVATSLMPAILGLADAVKVAADAFAALPPKLQGLIAGAAVLAVAWKPISAIFGAVVGVLKVLAALKLGATIAGWAGAIVPAITALKALAATVAAVVAGVVTAPVLITVAIAAVVGAVIAGVVIWRREIGGFFTWLAQSAIAGWNVLIAPLRPVIDGIVSVWASVLERVGAIYSALARMFYQLFIEPVVMLARTYTGILVSFWRAAFTTISGVVSQWVAGLQLAFGAVASLYFQIVIKPITDQAQRLWGFLVRGWNAFSTVTSGIFRAIATTYQNLVVKPLTTAWSRIVDTGKAALRGLLGWAAGAINGVIDMVNRLISGVNKARKAVGLKTIEQIQRVVVPAFAQGGYVTGPTVGLIGEAGREYVVPERKAQAFANNIIAGRRGAAAIPQGTTSSGGSSAGPISINITTGPVRQDVSGQRWMTIEDGERMAREVAAQVLRTQRTPGGRYAQGVR